MRGGGGLTGHVFLCVCAVCETEDSQTRTDVLKVLAGAIVLLVFFAL